MEVVELKLEIREGFGNGGTEERGVGGTDEVEEDVLWAGRVLEYREDCSHGASDVCGVEGHCDVDGFVGAYILSTVVGGVVAGVVGDGFAVRGVVELGGFFELLSESSGIIVGGRGG